MSLPSSSAPLGHLGCRRNIHWRKPCRGARHLTFIHAGFCCRHLRGEKGGLLCLSVTFSLQMCVCPAFDAVTAWLNCDAEVETSAGAGVYHFIGSMSVSVNCISCLIRGSHLIYYVLIGEWKWSRCQIGWSSRPLWPSACLIGQAPLFFLPHHFTGLCSV